MRDKGIHVRIPRRDWLKLNRRQKYHVRNYFRRVERIVAEEMEAQIDLLVFGPGNMAVAVTRNFERFENDPSTEVYPLSWDDGGICVP